MRAKYQISEENYVDVMRFIWKRSTKERIVFGFLASILAFSALNVDQFTVKNWPFWILIALLIYYFATPIFVSLIARQKYKKYHDQIGLQRDVELTENGLLFSTINARNLVRWDNIRRWRQDESFVLIYEKPMIVHILPKSILNQGFDIEQLIGILDGLTKRDHRHH